ncbi:hypothetical protein BCR39DRAFT_557533 [Naematelia encephala]|uniref:BZIP domain-containing protein n=1 Tax=Naematelia encephala TaxID=71784 RepID=A0A1Y2BCI9_9TREE|nr:hypothetical protein BCR39DRAFT_557533 [Naematelia encephala]
MYDGFHQPHPYPQRRSNPVTPNVPASHSRRPMLPRPERMNMNDPIEQRASRPNPQALYHTPYHAPLTTAPARSAPYPSPHRSHSSRSPIRSQEDQHPAYRLGRSGSLHGPISLLADVALADAVEPTPSSFMNDSLRLPPLQLSMSRSHDTMSQTSTTSLSSTASRDSNGRTPSKERERRKYRFGEIPPSPIQEHDPVLILNDKDKDNPNQRSYSRYPSSELNSTSSPISTSNIATPTSSAEYHHPLAGLSLDKTYPSGNYRAFMAEASRILQPPSSSASAAPTSPSKIVHPPPVGTAPLPSSRRNTLNGKAGGGMTGFQGPEGSLSEPGSRPVTPSVRLRPVTAGQMIPRQTETSGRSTLIRLNLDRQVRGGGRELRDDFKVKPIPPTPITSLLPPPMGVSEDEAQRKALTNDQEQELEHIENMSGASSSSSPSSSQSHSQSPSPSSSPYGHDAERNPRPHSESISSNLSVKTEPSQGTLPLLSPLIPRTRSNMVSEQQLNSTTTTLMAIRPRVSNRLKLRSEPSTPSTSTIQEKKEKKKYKYPRRTGEKRREQNASAQKRYREKKKGHREQMARELQASDTEKRLLQADLEERDREIERKARELVERDKEIGTLKRKLEAMGGHG